MVADMARTADIAMILADDVVGYAELGWGGSWSISNFNLVLSLVGQI